MNVNVTCNAVSLDTYLISYTREDNICNSTSILTLTLSINCPITFDFYDELIITEGGVKKGTYALLANSKNIPQGTITINASNTQKNLENHFIEEKYDMMDTPTLKTRYWIEKFMTEAGVDYTITATGDGEFIPSDMVLGGVMALDAVKQLLQYSGWYMRYDENGTAIVGTLDYDSTSYQVVVDDNDIIDFKIEENDAMLRNRVVVWGMGSSLLENNGWTFVDLSTTTPWNYDDNDKRTILLSNSLISDMTLANTIAKKTLDEFTKPNIVKTIKVKGFVDVMVGDRVYVNSKYYSKICTATTVYVGLEQNGTTTTLTLDERCPRLIGYFNYGGYVYVGTDGDGVWRKPLKYSDTWEDYSTGLGDLYIKDLSIAGGVMACVTTSGYLYVRYPTDTQWNRVSSFSLHDDIDNVTYATINGTIVACSVDRNTGVVYAGIRCSVSGTSEYRSWVGKVASPTNITTNMITVSGNSDYYINDLDSNNYAVYVNAFRAINSGYTIPSGVTEVLGGLHATRNYAAPTNGFYTRMQNEASEMNTSYNIVGTNDFSMYGFFGLDYSRGPHYLVAAYGRYLYFIITGSFHRFVRYNLDDGTSSEINVSWIVINSQLVVKDADTCFTQVVDGTNGASIALLDFSTATATIYSAGDTPVPSGDSSLWQHVWMGILGDRIILSYIRSKFNTIPTSYSDCFRCFRVFDTVTLTFGSLINYYQVYRPNETLDIYTSEWTMIIGNETVVGWFWDRIIGSPTLWYMRSFYLNTSGGYGVGDIPHTSTNAVSLNFPFVDIANNRVVGVNHNYPDEVNFHDRYSIDTAGYHSLGNFVNNTYMSTWTPFSASKSKVYVGQGNDIYDFNNNYLGTMSLSSGRAFNPSPAADDLIDGLVGVDYNTSDPTDSKIVRITFSPSFTETVVVSPVTMDAGQQVYLFGERFRVASHIYYADTDDSIIFTGGDEGKISTSIPYLIEHKDTKFKVISGVMSEGVDSSQDIPVAVYGGNETYNSGYLEVYAPPNRFDYVNLIYTTPSGIGETGFVYDIKSFGQLVPGSGYLRRSVFTRNTVIDGLSYLQLIDYDLDTIPGYIGYTINGGWVSFSGTAKYLEVSNNGDNPYFFTSIGGSPSGFYQKDKYDNNEISTTFRDCSYGLPNSEVRCIRVDDLV